MLITIMEASGLVNRPKRTVYHWIKDGKLPYQIQSGKTVVNEYDLLAVLPNRPHAGMAVYHSLRRQDQILKALDEACDGGYDVIDLLK